MRLLFTCICLLWAGSSFAQMTFPYFLEGTWKIKGRESYEQWEQNPAGGLKGQAYDLKKSGEHKITEQLSISQKGKDIVYTALVLGQNKGKPTDFRMVRSDSVFIFENPDHDFPKQIIYQRKSPVELFVKVTDGGMKGFSFTMNKVLPVEAKGTSAEANVNPKYDEALARKLGGDEYGMKSYWLVILKTGPVTISNKDSVAKIFEGHLANIWKLADERKIIVAGPLGKNERQYRGIFILDKVKTIEEARALLQSDPAVSSGLLEPEIFPWYGSAALPEYLEASDKIWKAKP